MDNLPLLIVLTGKTASGKDTIKYTLLKKYPSLRKIITTTSRIPRINEKDGVDYHFLGRREFEKKISEGDFAEYVEYGGNLYGTQKIELESALKKDTLWKIDPSRAGEAREFIKRAFPENISQELLKRILVIYINAPETAILQRLEKRNLGTEEIKRRIEDDKKIWDEYKDSYDFVVENENGKLDQTLEKITNIIENHH